MTPTEGRSAEIIGDTAIASYTLEQSAAIEGRPFRPIIDQHMQEVSSTSARPKRRRLPGQAAARYKLKAGNHLSNNEEPRRFP